MSELPSRKFRPGSGWRLIRQWGCSFCRRLVFARLRASSIIDLTVSMVILTLVTASALLLYLQVTRSGNTLQRLKWEMWLRHYADQTRRTASYQSERLSFAEGRVERKVSPYQGNPALIFLEIIFYPADADASGTTYQYREIIERPEQP